MESSGAINEGKNDIQVLLEKQDSQFRALTEALKDYPNNLCSALGNSASKLSRTIDEKLDKLNSVYTSGQLEDLNRERQETGTPSSDPNGKRRVRPAKLLGIQTKREKFLKTMTPFAPSDVDEDLQQEEDNPFRKVMFVINDTEPQ